MAAIGILYRNTIHWISNLGVAAIGILYKNTFHWIRNLGEWVTWAAIEIFYRNTWAAIGILQRNILHSIHNLGVEGGISLVP